MKLSSATVEQMLHEDIDTAEKELAAHLPWTATLDPVRRSVLVSLTFNIGITRLMDFKRTLASVQAGHYDTAAAQMLESRWADQVGDRAKRLAAQMRTGYWDGIPPRLQQVDDISGPIVTGVTE